MPRVRALQSIATPGWSLDRGQQIEVSPEVARDWQDRGMAELVRDEEAEHAVRRAPERTGRSSASGQQRSRR